MKNRNKRFTSVLAASMALGMMAPAMVSVAPVMAAETSTVPTSLTGELAGMYYDTGKTTDNIVYNIYKNPKSGAFWGTKGEYVAVLMDGSNFQSQESALKLGPTVTVRGDNTNTLFEAPLVGIADYAFADETNNSGECNTNISSVTIVGDASQPMVIGQGAFLNNSTISSVSLTNVKSIGQDAFACSRTGEGVITSVKFNDEKLTSIGSWSFLNQKGLKTVSIPNSVEYIGTGAFQRTGLTGTINLPSSITTLGAQAFDTTAPTLNLVWPTTSAGKDKAVAATILMPFAPSANRTYFKIIGVDALSNSLSTVAGNYNDLNGVWAVAPSITVKARVDTIGQTQLVATNRDVTVPRGTSLQISVTKAGTLTVGGDAVASYVYDNGNNTYTLVTPKLGTYTVTFTDEDNLSRTITITVTEYSVNYWIEGNFDVPTPWVVGTDENPSGAEAKYGDVYYLYSTTKNGEYHSEKPAYPGTWWVKAVVDSTDNYNGLETAPQSFQVIAAADINTGWVESGDNWMYKEDGEFVTSALKEIDGDTYLFDSEGIMVTGWAKNDTTNGNWMFFDNAGHAKKGWLNDEGTWYYLDSNAVMVANEWVKDAGKDYFLTDNGAMAVSRWLTKDGHDVYVDNSGALKTGWLAWNMNWYYLEPSTGYMATSGTVDGWNIQSNGIAVKA